MADPVSAVVLSGGGAYAAYEVGVMKALFRGVSPATRGVPLNAGIFTGTSAGAFNSALMAMQSNLSLAASVENLEQIWFNEICNAPGTSGNGVVRLRGDVLNVRGVAQVREFMDDALYFAQTLFRQGLAFARSTASLPKRLIDSIDVSAFISTEPFLETIKRTIDLDKVRTSSRLLTVAATNWSAGLLAVFENRHLTDEVGGLAIRASAAIPGVFPPVEINGDLHVDGGVIMNTPLKCAIDAGADELHVVYLNPDVKNIARENLQSTFQIFDRVFSIAVANMVNQDVETAEWVNQGIEALERLSSEAEPTDSDATQFVRVASRVLAHLKSGQAYRKITVHRYSPREDLGGMTGILDFGRQRIQDLIDRGYQDCVQHDCAKSHCVIPNSGSTVKA